VHWSTAGAANTVNELTATTPSRGVRRVPREPSAFGARFASGCGLDFPPSVAWSAANEKKRKKAQKFNGIRAPGVVEQFLDAPEKD
jgi:hypothetical protein